LKRLGQAVLFCALLLSATTGGAQAAPVAQGGTVPPAVKRIFDSMTAEERVGQLFLVTFKGGDTSDKSQVFDLIANHYVGGVVLLASNDNFEAAPTTVSAAYNLTSSLQQIEWASASNPVIDPETLRPVSHAYVPLLIATSQDGDGPPHDQIMSGITPLPSEMAIGATWSPDVAEKVGSVMGSELSAIGINMYLGPSLDVLENPNVAPGNDLGVDVFGGDPYWVSVLGSAYISGLHAGAQNRLLVVPKHFPGRGSADRSSDDEVATVRKSLDELKQIELAPFFAVTRKTAAPGATADGLLVSHIRYQGFQGNIRATTKPVSFDGQALASILSLPEFSAWRDNGGVVVSDNLGSNAVRQLYTSGTDFPARTVALDAFVAGNDLLYAGDIVSSDATDNYSTIVEILSFFAQKYRDDPAFSQRVDAAVLRVLTLKYRLFGQFNVNNIQRPMANLDGVGISQQVTFDVASRAATLLSPDAQDLATLIPGPPSGHDRILFFTDSAQVQQCSTCPGQPDLAVDSLQRAIVQLYGPGSGNQTSSFRLSSYSFSDLGNYLQGKPPPYLQENLSLAAWVVISLSANDNGQAQMISNFLAGQQDALREKRVVLFSFGAPLYLDATDISRLTAYYALYSKQAPFVDVAARILFKELAPRGAAPVSISGLGYDLISITSPDPNQIIALSLDLPAGPPSATDAPTPPATPVPLFKIGDTIAVRTGIIKDHNGQQVPDGTVVRFSMNLTGEGGGILQQADAISTQGVARISFGLDKPGLLQIHATSDPALVSEVLQLDVSGAGQPAAVTVIVPQLTERSPSAAVLTPQPSENEFVTSGGTLRFTAWLLTILLVLVGAASVSLAGARMLSRTWGVRWGLCALGGGLLIYNYLSLGLPGSTTFTLENGMGGVLLVVLAGLLGGWGAGWLWWRRTSS
jgi:beta-N-acetylhexosaminidase